MTEREAFKIGFLLRCAEAGVAPAACVPAAAGLIKAAQPPVPGPGLWGLPQYLLGQGLSAGANAALLAGVGVPLGVGAAGGYLAHKITDKGLTPEDVKQTEEADEYQRLARIARTNTRLRQLRARASQ